MNACEKEKTKCNRTPIQHKIYVMAYMYIEIYGKYGVINIDIYE